MENNELNNQNQTIVPSQNHLVKKLIFSLLIIALGMISIYAVWKYQMNKRIFNYDDITVVKNIPVTPTQAMQNNTELFNKADLKITRSEIGRLLTFEDDQTNFIQEYLKQNIIKEAKTWDFTCTPTYMSNYAEYEQINHYLDSNFFLIDYEKRSWDESSLKPYKINDPLLLYFIEQKNKEFSQSTLQSRLEPKRIDEITLCNVSNGKKLISYSPIYLYNDSVPGPPMGHDLIVNYYGEQEYYITDDQDLSKCHKKPNALTKDWIYYTCNIGDGLGVAATLRRINIHSSTVENIFSCSGFYETEIPEYKCDIIIE